MRAGRRPRFSVQWPLLATLTSVAILSAGPAVWLFLHAVSDERAQARESIELVAELAARHADHIVVEAFFELEQLADGAGRDGGRLPEDPEPLTNFTAPVLVLDSRGVPREPAGSLQQWDEAGSVLSAAAASEDRSVSAPFVSPATGHATSALAIPILADDGSRRGTVVGLLDLERHLAAELSETVRRLGPTAHADIIGMHGVVLASTDHDSITDASHSDFYRSAAEGMRTVVGELPAGSVAEPHSGSHVVAYAPMGAAPWGVAVGGPRRDIYRRADDLNELAIRLGLPSLAVLLVGFVLASVRIGTRGAAGPAGTQSPMAGANRDAAQPSNSQERPPT